MTDLQSVALATWLRSRRTVDRHNLCFELNFPNREIQNRWDGWTKVPSEVGADRSHRLEHGQPTSRGVQGHGQVRLDWGCVVFGEFEEAGLFFTAVL